MSRSRDFAVFKILLNPLKNKDFHDVIFLIFLNIKGGYYMSEKSKSVMIPRPVYESLRRIFFRGTGTQADENLIVKWLSEKEDAEVRREIYRAQLNLNKKTTTQA